MSNEEVKTKRCAGCGVVKTHSEFTKRSSTKSGLSSRCRDCQRLARPKIYARDKERRRVKRMSRDKGKTLNADGVLEQLKECKKCGRVLFVSEFYRQKKGAYGTTAHCRKCMNAYAKEKANLPHVKAQRRAATKKYTQTEQGKAKRREYQRSAEQRAATRERNTRNQERRREWQRNYSQKHRLKCREWSRKSKRKRTVEALVKERAQRKLRDKENANMIRAQQSEYARKHPGIWSVGHQNRRARHFKVQGRYTLKQWLDKCTYHGWTCLYCHAPLTIHTVEADHRKPLSRGGTGWISNIAPSCRSCNARKFTKTESEFREILSEVVSHMV